MVIYNELINTLGNKILNTKSIAQNISTKKMNKERIIVFSHNYYFLDKLFDVIY